MRSSPVDLLKDMFKKRVTKAITDSIIADSSNHLVAALKSLQWRTTQEMNKILRDQQGFCICYNPEDETPKKISVERMVGMLPQHLMAVLMSPERGDRFQYVLSGIRLLNTLCELTSRHHKLEQVLLDDVHLAGQMIDLVRLTVVVLGSNKQERCYTDHESLMDATLLASSLYLLHGFISPNSQDLVHVLLAERRVDVFIDAAFGAVHNAVRALTKKILVRRTDLPKKLGSRAAGAISAHCLQAEATLQFLHSLCQHKLFKDRVAENKDLCENSGVLVLAQSVLSLTITPDFGGEISAIASISRMKAKVLSILQHLFEAESVSFLDVVAKAGNLHLAKSLASEVFKLLRAGLSMPSVGTAPPPYPMGFVLLNAMRLADVLTDDSNVRSFFTENLSPVLSAIFCQQHGDFLQMLCSSQISSREDDAALDYDLFTSAGWVLSVFSSFDQSGPPQFKFSLQNNLTMASYAHQRTSLLIKVMSNLHCFVPNLCQEEDRNSFIKNFMSGLKKDPATILPTYLSSRSYIPLAERGSGVWKNLGSLMLHAQSLLPNFLTSEDLLLFRVFSDQYQELLKSEDYNELKKKPLNLNNEEALDISDVPVEGVMPQQGVTKEMEIVQGLKVRDADASILETSGSDTSSNRGKSPVEGGELGQTNSAFGTQRKKRKRSVMHEGQIAMMEKALITEPDMLRNSASIQVWSGKLSQEGPDVVTASQLKNWLNNRKAKLARANAKLTGTYNSSGDLAESPGEENTWQNQGASSSYVTRKEREPLMRLVGQTVAILDKEMGEEIGKGVVLGTDGEWYGFNLETRKLCLVDVIELRGSDAWSTMTIPYGSAAVGRTFGEAKSKFGGVMRVVWDVSKIQILLP